MNYTTIIPAAQLKTLVATEEPLLIFDCSFDLMRPQAGAEQFAQAHIPGAIFADLDRHLCAKDRSTAASGGRHPLPQPEAFAQWLGSVGLSNDMQVVVYDRQGMNFCGRLWWMLKWAGHERVAVLDGGLAAWTAAGGVCAQGDTSARPAQHFALLPAKAALVTAAQVLERMHAGDQILIDARGEPRYRGEVEPLDPVAGHIPGALNRPFGSNIDDLGFFKSAGALRSEFMKLLGERDPACVVHQCGSGVSAVANIMAMEIAGLGRQPLFAGSWSEWCSDPARPVAKGNT